jgi:hypothetical protein
LVSKEEEKRVLHKKVLPALQELFESNIAAAENTLDVNSEMGTKYTLTYDDICEKVREPIDGEADPYHYKRLIP